MYLSSFIFDKKEYDDAFYALDGEIEALARALPGFIGMESFTDTATGRLLNNYYWQDQASMDALISGAMHLKAKRQSAQWIAGYQTIIAHIEGAHNSNLDHPLADRPVAYIPGKPAQ
ncbi:hypothetical protein F9C28_08325 [Shimwellia pseudoproteus]|uniref:antibiotic biosynthesis monooxygenase family protein n=1 Tax=Shimwellia pseudoproteus TaxID=570012 RepID=UPI0018EC1ED2|nr:hypothetical protein [Shimwellia pseudoproteus]MBJ3814931.1 hypothetical protein [Shimwellia pseudoproteus]